MSSESKFPKWHWGAFLSSFSWGMRYKRVLTILLVILPIVGFVMMGFFSDSFLSFVLNHTTLINYFVGFFVLSVSILYGYNGYNWAHQKKEWPSEDQFYKVQKRWAYFGIAKWSLLVTLISSVIISLSSNPAYIRSQQIVQSNSTVIENLGQPIKLENRWFVQGSTHTSGDTGYAEFFYNVKGSKETGNIAVVAKKYNNQWHIYKLFFKPSHSQDQKFEELALSDTDKE